MGNIEIITMHIEGKQREIMRLTKKLGRIEAAKATNWEKNPQAYRELDLKNTLKTLGKAKSELNALIQELGKESSKEDHSPIPTLTEFLDNWLDNCLMYFKEEKEKYDKAFNTFQEKVQEHNDWYSTEGFKYRRQNPELYKQREDDYIAFRNKFNLDWSHVTQFSHGSLTWEETLLRDLKAEYERKYEDIVGRITRVCGNITDASGLRITAKDDLTGLVIGENGRAKVSTTGAGARNLQSYHFRITVKEV